MADDTGNDKAVGDKVRHEDEQSVTHATRSAVL
jgi:hypothetical protein